MQRNYYLFQNGLIKRKDHSFVIIPSDQESSKKHLPIENIESLYLFGEYSLNTKLLNFLAQKNICLHVFNYYGFYSGSYYPRDFLLSGHTLVNQVKHYTHYSKRIALAQELVMTASDNILRVLKYYQKRGRNIKHLIQAIEKEQSAICEVDKIPELLGREGRMRDQYYEAFDAITGWQYSMGKRIRRPPNNMMNALISWGNSLLYTTCLSELYKTNLNPTISWLHEPGERRYSLALDLSEVFKPLLVDKVIFRLINLKMLDKKDFDQNLQYCYLKESGRKKYLEVYEERLQTTIKHRLLGRSVSYRRLIRLECYKLVKHILGEKPYQGFRAWW